MKIFSHTILSHLFDNSNQINWFTCLYCLLGGEEFLIELQQNWGLESFYKYYLLNIFCKKSKSLLVINVIAETSNWRGDSHQPEDSGGGWVQLQAHLQGGGGGAGYRWPRG